MNSSEAVDGPITSFDPSSIRKAALKNPAALFGSLPKGHNGSGAAKLLSQIEEQFTPLADRQLSLTTSRKALSGSIGRARKHGEDIQALLQESKLLSMELKTVDSQIATLIDSALAIHQSIAPSSAEVQPENAPEVAIGRGPGQFLPPPPSDGVHTGDIAVSPTSDAQRWNHYVTISQHATHYHQYEWRGVIERNFAQKCRYFTAEDSKGEFVGLAASVQMDSRIFGSFMLSMPFLIYGGPLADNQQVNNILAAHLASTADQGNCTHTELRETHPREGWYSKTEKVAMVLELPESVDDLNKNLGSKLLAQIRRAVKEQPEFRLGGSELIPEFYSVFARKMRDLGTPVYAMDFFKDMARTFPESTHVAVVHLKGEPVAAAFLISYRNTLEIPWAASVRKFDRLGMNMFLYHSLLQHAVTQRFQFFDFGRSTRGESTWSFKKQWGAQERQLHWHFLSQGAPYDPGSGNASAKFALAVAVWKRLPLWISNRIGPVIARQLPW